MGVPDNGPIIAGVTWWLTTLSGGFLGTRVYAKLSRKQGLWWDDHILVASWILLLVEAILTQIGVLHGYGKHTADIPPENLAFIALGTSVAASISCFASTFSKISFGITLLRLTTEYLRWFVWFCIVTLFMIMLPSALITWIRCSPVQKAWDNQVEGECWDPSITINYGIFNAAWCAAADIALALIPWWLIWGLQLNLREKIGVGIAMSMGVLAGACAIIKGMYLMQLAEQDFFYNGKDVTIWTAVETATAIIGASIPILRVFFKETISSYQTSHSNTRSNKSIPLSRLNPSQQSSTATATTVQAMGKGKDFGYISLKPADGQESPRGFPVDEERALERDVGISQASTVTVTIESEGRKGRKTTSWLDVP